MTDLGSLKFFFANVHISRCMWTRQTTLKQTHYVEDMLDKCGLADTHGKVTPCTKSIYDQRLLDPVTPHPPNSDDNYSSQVGTLGYLRHIRPDLCVALGVSTQHVKKDRHAPPHYHALHNIMRHCTVIMDRGLHYKHVNPPSN